MDYSRVSTVLFQEIESDDNFTRELLILRWSNPGLVGRHLIISLMVWMDSSMYRESDLIST